MGIVLRGENNLDGNDEALIVVDGVVINRGSDRHRTAISGESSALMVPAVITCLRIMVVV